uniref:AIG1-type G domain-containing protein n=1 Tax=Panagrolaimus sp. JU765 TaxID=591449 RepID=A0AC34QD49_9BILA
MFLDHEDSNNALKSYPKCIIPGHFTISTIVDGNYVLEKIIYGKPDNQESMKTIFCQEYSLNYKGKSINFIDTPGFDGDTMGILHEKSRQLQQNDKNLNLPLDKKHIFCFNNVPFQYLIAKNQNERIELMTKENFKIQWNLSKQSMERFLDWILNSQPYQCKEFREYYYLKMLMKEVLKLMKEVPNKIPRQIQQNDTLALYLLVKNLYENELDNFSNNFDFQTNFKEIDYGNLGNFDMIMKNFGGNLKFYSEECQNYFQIWQSLRQIIVKPIENSTKLPSIRTLKRQAPMKRYRTHSRIMVFLVFLSMLTCIEVLILYYVTDEDIKQIFMMLGNSL